MTSEQVKIFYGIAKHLSFTKAADELYTTQPTVSRQIKSLEDEWGVTLFTRERKTVRLTPEGTVMLKCCREMDKALSESLKIAHGIARGEKGTIRIGILQTMDDSEFVMPSLDYFSKNHPNVRFIMEKCSFAELRKRLDDGLLDVIITLDFESAYLKNVEIENCARLDTLFVVSNRHPLFSKENLSIHDFSHVRFVVPEPDDSPGRKEKMEEIFDRLDLRGNEVLPVANMDTVFLNIRAGKVVGILDSGTRDINETEFRYVVLPDKIGCLNLISAWKKENTNKNISLFLKVFRNHFKARPKPSG